MTDVLKMATPRLGQGLPHDLGEMALGGGERAKLTGFLRSL